jgi:hypothetical protein
MMKELEINGVKVIQRDDGFINATLFCKAKEISWADYSKRNSARVLFAALEKHDNILLTDLMDLFETREDDNESTCELKATIPNETDLWVPQEVVVDLMAWIYPEFKLQVLNWAFTAALAPESLADSAQSASSSLKRKNPFCLTAKEVKERKAAIAFWNKSRTILKDMGMTMASDELIMAQNLREAFGLELYQGQSTTAPKAEDSEVKKNPFRKKKVICKKAKITPINPELV